MRVDKEWYDRSMRWHWGVDLRQWMLGFNVHSEGFFIALGPFYVGCSDVPY